jgi:GntR family transcriptional repressor for pyruvate dehydrogenase complex
MSTREFPALKKTSVSLQAADAIKSLIVSGELGSGDALPPERDLAVMLGISRPSVREAIRVLTAMNVVEPRHGGGTYVTSLHPRLLARPINFLLQIEPRTFMHLFEVRQVLEVAAARLAAPKMTDELVDELADLAAAAASALKRPERYLELDFDLHTRIIEATGNPIYLSLYESIADLLLESRRRTARIPAVRDRAHDDHLAIVAALRARDPERAAHAMQDHLEGMRSVLDQMLAHAPRPAAQKVRA